MYDVFEHKTKWIRLAMGFLGVGVFMAGFGDGLDSISPI